MTDSGNHGPATPNEKPDQDDHSAAIDDRPLNEQLGIETHYLPDAESPPVDEKRLLAFVRRELPAFENAEVVHLLATFRPWHRAWAEVLRHEAFKGGRSDNPPGQP